MPIHYSEGEFPLDTYCGHYTEQFQNSYNLNNIHNCDCCQPYNINHAVEKLQRATLMITNVSAKANYSIDITIDYSDGTSKTYALEKGKRYKVQYLANGELNTLVGVITKIGKVNSNSNCSCDCCSGVNDYIIRVDASINYSSVVEDIRTSNIRDIQPYVEHADEDSTILNAHSSGVTVAGLVNAIVITDATIDEDGNIYSGTITKGVADDKQCIIVDGCATGVNPLNNFITVANAKVIGGTITTGKIMSGKMEKYTIISQGNCTCDCNDSTKTIMSKCIVESCNATIVATDCNVVGSKAYDGTVINPVIEKSTVVGGTRSGKDMVTTGAMVIGDIAYGGTITGGTLVGGTATGKINDIPYIIQNGITEGGTSMKCTITNGKIVGGKTVNGSVIGATVYGGIAKCGVTTDGTTTISDNINSYIKPESVSLPSDMICKCPEVYGNYKDMIGDMIIWFKTNNGYKPHKM